MTRSRNHCYRGTVQKPNCHRAFRAIQQIDGWWSGTASIRRPPVFQTGALPTELPDLPDQTLGGGLAGGSDGI